MASYNYGPPPPAPVVAPAGNTPGSYGYSQSYPQHSQRGGHMSHGGRGGGGGGPGGPYNGARADYHGAAPAGYGYSGQQPVPYPQSGPSAYGPAQQPQAGYAPQQQWPNDQGPHHQPPQQPSGPAATSLSPQNYHPNYAPQHYQRSSSYAQQPPAPHPSYGPPPQPAYGQPYQAGAAPQGHGWPAPPHSQSQFGGGGRGRGGHHNERGGSRAQVMGPPIRMGFDPASQQGHVAPVSNGYAQPYAAPPQGAGASYPPAPYAPYPQPSPVYPTAPYDSSASHGPRHQHGRGGFHNANNSFKTRPQLGGDKMRHRKHAGPSQAPSAQHQKPDAPSAGKKKKRKTNTLGLTPDDAGDDSNEELENEEEMLTELIGDDAPNPTDIAAWIADRRKKFPTKARADAKRAGQGKSGASKKETDDRDAELERQQQKAEKLRRQLENLETSIKRKREQQDEGDDMRTVDASPSSSSDSKSDDEKPEVASTREEAAVPPPAKKADQSKHCKYFSTGGVCGKKGKCRFVHDPEVREAALKERERNGGRMTLQQRLILNDKEQEDLTIVKTLAYLRDKGLMHGSRKSAAGGASGSAAQSAPKPKAPSAQDPSSASLPAPPVKTEQSGHGLPAIPPQPNSLSNNTPAGKRYEGWNLSGFGNTGVKAGDI